VLENVHLPSQKTQKTVNICNKNKPILKAVSMSKNNIPSISLNSQIQIHPLSQQVENGVVIVGREGKFLELPLAGIEFINWLNDGLTLNEAKLRFEAKFNPFPEADLLAFIQTFNTSGFIASVDGQIIPIQHTLRPTHSDFVSKTWAKRLFSTPVLITWFIMVIPAIGIWVNTPQFWPRYQNYFWIEHNFIIILVGILLWLGRMGMHEVAHLVAARAKGIRATITWTQRVGFMPMSQTIMHDIWTVPRQARLLPLAAGLMLDMFQLAIVIYLLFFQSLNLIALSSLTINFLEHLLLIIVLAATAQFRLFSRMDGYFIFSSLFGQRNLQADTYQWVKSKFYKAVSFTPPTNGMKFVYIYAVITIIWGGFFVGEFLLIRLPIKFRLIWESFVKINSGSTISTLDFADGVTVLASQIIYFGLLFYVYFRETIPNWRKS